MAKLNKHSSDQFTVSRPAFSMNGRMYKTLSLKATTTNVWQIKVKELKSWRWSDQGDLMSLSWCLGHFAGRIWVPLRCDGSLLIIKNSSKWFYNETFSLLWEKSFLGWVCPCFSKGHVGLLSGLRSDQLIIREMLGSTLHHQPIKTSNQGIIQFNFN